MNGKVVAIFICPDAGEPMRQVQEVEAVAGEGLEGDRYCYARGSFSKLVKGNRQVTLIGARSFTDSGFEYSESRRNIVTENVELMWLIGREFIIGKARMKGVKYCDPCNRPSKLSGKEKSFKEAFFDRGGLVAEILESGLIRTDDQIIPPEKKYWILVLCCRAWDKRDFLFYIPSLIHYFPYTYLMPFTRTTFLRIIKASSGVLVVLLIAAYALWRSLNYARGPQILITEPLNGASISTPTVMLRGQVERANTITLNGKVVLIDEQGNFNETIIIFPGTNILTFEARDQFERSVQTQLRIFGK